MCSWNSLFNLNTSGREDAVNIAFERAGTELKNLPEIANLIVTILRALGAASAEPALCVGQEGSNSFPPDICLTRQGLPCCGCLD